MRLRRASADTSALGIRAGEHVIAVAETASGSPVAATDKALYSIPADAWRDMAAPGPLEPATARQASQGERLAWSAIAAARWQEPFLLVDIADDQGRPGERLRLELGEGASRLAAAVHDRVTASVVVTERVELPSGALALFTAREDSDSGAIRWSVVFDSGLDPSDPVLRQEATDKLAALRGSLGI